MSISPEYESLEPHQSKKRKAQHLRLHSSKSASVPVDEEEDLLGQLVENLENHMPLVRKYSTSSKDHLH